MDNSNGSLVALSGATYPTMRSVLGQYLVDKTTLIEKIVTTGVGQRVDLILRLRHCGKS
jgi:hypothetical protein